MNRIFLFCLLFLTLPKALVLSEEPKWGEEAFGVKANLSFKQETDSGAGTLLLTIKNSSKKTVTIQNDKDINAISVITKEKARSAIVFKGESENGRTELYTFDVPPNEIIIKRAILIPRSVEHLSGITIKAKIRLDSVVSIYSNEITIP